MYRGNWEQNSHVRTTYFVKKRCMLILICMYWFLVFIAIENSLDHCPPVRVSAFVVDVCF